MKKRESGERFKRLTKTYPCSSVQRSDRVTGVNIATNGKLATTIEQAAAASVLETNLSVKSMAQGETILCGLESFRGALEASES